MPEVSTIHHEYLARSASLIALWKEIGEQVTYLSGKIARFNEEHEAAAKGIRQLPVQDRDWPEQLIGLLPRPITEITITVVEPQDPSVSRYPKVDSKIR